MKLQTSLLYISIVISKKYVSTNCTELSFWGKNGTYYSLHSKCKCKEKKKCIFSDYQVQNISSPA